MRHLLAILLSLACCACCACCASAAKPGKVVKIDSRAKPVPAIPLPKLTPPLPSKYKLVWSDEFTGTALDRTKWLPHAHWRTTYDPADVYVRDGAVNLVLRKSHNWRPADISTYGKFTPQFGYLEARIRNFGGQGNHAWGAFYSTKMVPNAMGSTFTKSAEIDAWEILGAFPRDRQMVLHSNTGGGGNTPDRTWHSYDTTFPPNTWTVLGAHWTKSGVNFYANNKVVATGPANSPYAQEILASLNQPQFLMFANWECDFYEPAQVNASSPDSMTMQIDWVRFWK